MESSPPFEVDPTADLALLQRAKDSAGLHAGLNPGPWWYAPVLALILVPLGLPADWGLGADLIAVGALALILLHSSLFGTVRANPSDRAWLALAQIAVPAGIASFALWLLAIEFIGRDNLLPWWTLAGWLISTALYLGARAALKTVLTQHQVMQ